MWTEQMSVQTGQEDRCGGCGGNVFRQTVPDTSSGDRRSAAYFQLCFACFLNREKHIVIFLNIGKRTVKNIFNMLQVVLRVGDSKRVRLTRRVTRHDERTARVSGRPAEHDHQSHCTHAAPGAVRRAVGGHERPDVGRHTETVRASERHRAGDSA